MSRHEFAESIMDIARRWRKVKTNRGEPILTADYPSKARPPAFSALDCNLIEKNFGINPMPWRQSLISTIRRLCEKTEAVDVTLL